MIQKNRWLLFLVGIVFLTGLIYVAFRNISNIEFLPQTKNLVSPQNAQKQSAGFSVGVISRYAPSRTFQLYQPLIDDLTQTMGIPISLKLSRDYSETVQQLADGQVKMAFLGSYIFALSGLDQGLQAIAAPVNREGSAFTRVALVVPEGSSIQSVQDLRGKSMALPSQASFSTNWFKEIALRQNEMDVEDLLNVQYFDFHHTVIFQVMFGASDAGVVRESVAEEYKNQGIRVLQYSDMFPSPPVVCRRDEDPGLKEEILDALLAWNTKQGGPLAKYGFARVENKDYLDLRAMFPSREVQP